MAKGGGFSYGFISCVIGQVAGMFAMNGPLANISGAAGSTIRSVFAGAAGGAAAALTGGKFVNGFVTAAFAQMWNRESGLLRRSSYSAKASFEMAGKKCTRSSIRWSHHRNWGITKHI